MKPSEKRRGPRQVAFGLRDGRLLNQDSDVVRRNIENLIEFSQRFRETSECTVGFCLCTEQAHVVRVELLGFVKV